VLTYDIAGKHLATENKNVRFQKVFGELMENLPIPPIQQIGDFVPLRRIIQEVQDALVELFRVCRDIGPREYR
jgi:hypothetical protein